ncbi:MAG TPA: hypothetical protein VEK08_19535 [Planctomycetota bacterium]|nr:hypothetical protein [Planctomycetota bacterium]
MADDRPRGPSEYATKEAEPRLPAKRRPSFFFRLLGLLLVLFAGWLGWYSYRQGQLPDLTNEAQQKKMLEQAKADLQKAEEKTSEASRKFVSWAQVNLEELKTRIKGKPPESKEEISTLVNESKKEVGSAEKNGEPTLRGAGDKDSGAKKPEAAKPASKADTLIAEARSHYRTGLGAYAQTDPSASQQVIQAKLREAEPHFVKCLDLLEQARAQGAGGAELDSLEQAAAKRLYDCRKRMELARG